MTNMYENVVLDKLAGIDRKLDLLLEAVTPEVVTGAHVYPHPVAPGPGAIVFGPDMREMTEMLPVDQSFPMLSTCLCGRQICQTSPASGWEYCGA